MKNTGLKKGALYRFRRAAHDDYESYVFVSGDEGGARFEVIEHDPTDGREESRGTIDFDSYQISQLMEIRTEDTEG